MTLLSTLDKLFASVARAPGRGTVPMSMGAGPGVDMVEADGAFSTAVTALGAKLASADGPQRPGEFDDFAAIFRPQPAAEADVRRLYRLARQPTLGFESYAAKLARRYKIGSAHV